jgi:putative flavoprotein involved in K+ transport
MEQFEAIIIGAGQAGLAVSHELSAADIDHVVLDRGGIGQAWRERWDSFCLVTPNWTVRLPGRSYEGSDPDGFMPRDQIVTFLEGYARSFRAPVREGVAVSTVTPLTGGGFLVSSTSGDMRCRVLVLATGAFQHAYRPAAADMLPASLAQMDVGAYRNERALPAGSVLIVGSGQSGAQISEELREAGRQVVLSCGKAPWVPRRLGGRDVVRWLGEAGFFDQAVGTLLTPAARLTANPLVTGHGGGRDLNLRTLQAMGVTLTGRFLGAREGIARFAPDLGESVAWGDARYGELMRLVSGRAAEIGVSLRIEEPSSFNAAAPESLDLSGFGVAIFAGGFRPDYRSWLPWPEAFDDLGFPIQTDGASIPVPGLFFAGVHFLRKRKSSLLLGVGEDAEIIAQQITDTLAGGRRAI